MQGTILDAVRRRFALRSNHDDLRGQLALQSVREYFDDKTIEGSLRHGILKIRTDDHHVIMSLHRERPALCETIYQKRAHYGLEKVRIKRIIIK